MRPLSDDKAGDRAWLLGVLAIAVVLSLLASRWTFDMWSFQNDELLFRSTAEWIGDNLPSSLWATEEYARGVQRLNAWLLAFCLNVFGMPDGFKVARWVIVFAFASTVVPVWLLARAAGSTRIWAAIASLSSVLVPWAVLTGTFLTEGLAYPLFGWACLAIWNAALKHSTRADLIALAAIGAAMFVRTGMVLLVVALGVAVVVQELRLAGGLRDLPRVPARFARRHPLLLSAGVAGLLLMVSGRSDSIKGSWYSEASPRWGDFWHGLAYVVSSVGTGVAFVAVIVAIGFALTQLVRPSGPRALAVAGLVVGTLATFVLVLISGPEEERYVFYWALPCAVALGVAASGRTASVPGVVAGAVLVVVSMGERFWRTEVYEIYGFVLFPAETFQARVVRLGVNERLPGSLSLDPALVSALVIVAAAVIAALIASPLPRTVRSAAPPGGRVLRVMGGVAVVLGGLVVLAGAVQAGWAMKKFVDHGGGGRDLESRTALEQVLAGRDVGLWLQPALPLDANTEWEQLAYFTSSVKGQYRLGASQLAPRFEGDAWRKVGVDRKTGHISPLVRWVRLPELMAVVVDQRTAPLRGQVVANDPSLGLEVVRMANPASVRWLSGPSLDGAVGANAVETVRVFPPFAPGSCLRLNLSGNGQHTVRFRAGRQAVTLRPGGNSRMHVPLSGSRATTVTVRLRGDAEQLPDGSEVAGRVVADDVVKCPRPAARR